MFCWEVCTIIDRISCLAFTNKILLLGAAIALFLSAKAVMVVRKSSTRLSLDDVSGAIPLEPPMHDVERRRRKLSDSLHCLAHITVTTSLSIVILQGDWENISS